MIKNKGFTLIELLVVISIIGILSSIVLTSLNTARDKARDAAIQSTISSIRSEAEIYYSDPSNTGYTGMCDSDGVVRLLSSIEKQFPPDAEPPYTCDDGPANFVIEGSLNSGASYCVDSNGYSGLGTANINSLSCDEAGS